MKKLIIRLMALALAAVLLCGCNQEEAPQRSDVNFANTVMAGDVFAYRDGFIYFADYGGIYEYDTQSGVTVLLDRINGDGMNLVATEDSVLYREVGGTSMRYITRDGKESGSLFQRENLYSPFLDGDTWYYCTSCIAEDGSDSAQFWSRDAQTGEETLLWEGKGIKTYYVDADYLYIVELETVIIEEADDESGTGETTGVQEKQSESNEQEDDDRKERPALPKVEFRIWLHRSSKDKIAFEEVKLDIQPIKLFADGEDLYISRVGDWQIWHYADGVENALPIASFNYQVFDGHMVYIAGASGTMNGMGNPLKTYHLETRETKLIAESVYCFAVLGARYVAYGVNLGGSNFRWYVYDWQTGETKEMVKPV